MIFLVEVIFVLILGYSLTGALSIVKSTGPPSGDHTAVTAFLVFYHIQISASTARLNCLVEWCQTTRWLDILTVHAFGTIAALLAVAIKPESTTPIMRVTERWHHIFIYDASSTACL